MLAENFVGLNSDGTTADRAKVLENTTKSKWETNEISDVKIVVTGNTAITTEAVVAKAPISDGAPPMKAYTGQWSTPGPRCRTANGSASLQRAHP